MSSSNPAPRERDAVPSYGLALDFMRVLWEVEHRLQSRSKKMAARLGVTGPQRLVVRLIGKRPGSSAGELARALHLHPSTLTGVLRRLEERGVIKRKTSAHDGRRSELVLTSKGREIDRWQLGTTESLVRRALFRLNDKEVASARRVLRAIADALGEVPVAGANAQPAGSRRRAIEA